MKKILSALLLTFGFAYQAQAGVLIEPYLGYNGGTIKASLPAPFPEVSEGMTGVVYGARLGYKMAVFYVAADYSMGSLKAEISNSDTDFKVSRFGAVAGFTGLPMVDFYAGYLFNSSMEVDETGGAKFAGSGFKLGVAFTTLPLISINLEYIMNSFDDETPYTDVKESAAVLSVSVPFDL